MIIFGSLKPFEINTLLTYLTLSSSVDEVHMLGALCQNALFEKAIILLPFLLNILENLTKEISRILSRNGKIIIAFSNRAFWHKAPNIWTSSTEEERVKYVRKVLISNGFNEPKIIKEFSDQALNIFNFFNKDPFYCLIATKE